MLVYPELIAYEILTTNWKLGVLNGSLVKKLIFEQFSTAQITIKNAIIYKMRSSSNRYLVYNHT